ncbi:unnamed protein product, partial [Clonostachys solani]
MKPQVALIVLGLVSSSVAILRKLDLPFEDNPNVSLRRQGKCDRRTSVCTDYKWNKKGRTLDKRKQKWEEATASVACAPKS